MSEIEKVTPSFTVWVFQHDIAQHHDNDLTADTVDDINVATAIARFRVKDTDHNTGWAKIIDNNISGKGGDKGHILNVEKNSDGVVYVKDKRDGITLENIQARASNSYIGPIIKAVGDDFVIQNAGRNRPILHQLSKLESEIEVGNWATVKYNEAGRGRVELLDKSKDLTVSR